jgi:hypothetical protein
MPWYERWFGIEPPFPWLLVVVAASVSAPILLGLLAVIVGMHYLPWWH